MKKDISRDQDNGPLLTFKWVRTVKERRKTESQTTLNSRMRRNSRISVANVNEELRRQVPVVKRRGKTKHLSAEESFQ